MKWKNKPPKRVILTTLSIDLSLKELKERLQIEPVTPKLSYISDIVAIINGLDKEDRLFFVDINRGWRYCRYNYNGSWKSPYLIYDDSNRDRLEKAWNNDYGSTKLSSRSGLVDYQLSNAFIYSTVDDVFFTCVAHLEGCGEATALKNLEAIKNALKVVPNEFPIVRSKVYEISAFFESLGEMEKEYFKQNLQLILKCDA